jgi:hypothetical protein
VQGEPFASQRVDECRVDERGGETSCGLRDVIPVFQKCWKTWLAGSDDWRKYGPQSDMDRGRIPCAWLTLWF